MLREKSFQSEEFLIFLQLHFHLFFPVGFIGFIFFRGNISLGGTVRLILFIIIALAANLYFQPKARSLEIKDGTISILFLIFVFINNASY